MKINLLMNLRSYVSVIASAAMVVGNGWRPYEIILLLNQRDHRKLLIRGAIT